MNERPGIPINVSSLGTEAGVTEVGALMAEVCCKDILWPVIERTPPQMRQAIFERFLSGIAGALLVEVGPEKAKQTLDAVKLAIDDCVNERRAKH